MEERRHTDRGTQTPNSQSKRSHNHWPHPTTNAACTSEFRERWKSSCCFPCGKFTHASIYCTFTGDSLVFVVTIDLYNIIYLIFSVVSRKVTYIDASRVLSQGIFFLTLCGCVHTSAAARAGFCTKLVPYPRGCSYEVPSIHACLDLSLLNCEKPDRSCHTVSPYYNGMTGLTADHAGLSP